MATAWDRVRGLVRFDALVLAAAIWFLAKFLRYAFPPLFPAFGESFAVSNAALGGAFTAMMTVYAATQFPSGALADRIGAVTVVVAGAVVAAVGALALVAPVPFAALVGAMSLVGLGTGAHKTVAVRLLSRTYPRRTGRALGVLDTFGAFGGVAAPAAVVALVAVRDWHTVFLVGGAAGLLLAGAFAVRAPRRVPPPPARDDDERTDPRAYLRLFRDPRFAAFVGVTLCFSFAYNGVVAFLPSYLVTVGLSEGTASGIYSLVFVVSLVQLVTGDLSDRAGRLPVIGATLLVAAASLAALTFVGRASSVTLAGLSVAFGLGSHGFRPVRGAYLSAVIPESVAGGGLGVVRTLLMGAGAVAPAIIGVLADTASFSVAFGLLAVSMAAAAVLTAVVAVLE